ncbi:HNH endonuclease [Deinococcus sp. 6YEL10]|uniref:HNH endonuclease n=1 Tax=Deinococcus sp. 6YEL10 TaxID=2745870 RepID=UPI001E52FE8C|nr:HNH endonuclease [Deinococcus sp. 6YEL10]MCD0159713.1 HNH endonuclease [Deinococcus sp. 6YEL10]
MAQYFRKGRRYSPAEIFALLLPVETGKRPAGTRELDGDPMYFTSLRYHVFKKDLCCASCGIQGQYFVKEANLTSERTRYHLNLYAVNEAGEEVLMTKDHILPRKRGGKDTLTNLETMCSPCNAAKGARTDIDRILQLPDSDLTNVSPRLLADLLDARTRHPINVTNHTTHLTVTRKEPA